MKLASVYFDDNVVIPGAKDVGGGASRQDLRESSFHAADGWDIDWDGRVLFTLWREGMASVAKVGGYGFTFVAETSAKSESVQRMNEIADGLEANGEPPMAAMKQAIDAVLGPEEKPRRSRKR